MIQRTGSPDAVGEITHALERIQIRPELFDQHLVPLLYPYLKQIAANRLRREGKHCTFRPTELANEIYLRLRRTRVDSPNRGHLLACVAKVTRDILVDHARRRNAHKRGPDDTRVSVEGQMERFASPRPLSFDPNASERPVSLDEVLAVHNAISRLQAIHPKRARLIELKFFGGLSTEEAAEVLEMGVTTAKTNLQIAYAWIKREIGNTAQ